MVTASPGETPPVKKLYFLLVLVCLALYLPGLARLPPTDRDEARFAQASKQMLESGNYIDIRFQNEPRYKKPIGIYWLQAAAAGMTTGPTATAIWPYRLPSLAGALLAVLLTFGLGRTLVGTRAALWGALLLAGCVLLTVEAHLAKTDAMLLASIVAMQGALGRAYLKWRRGEPAGWANVLLFWGGCGGGVLLKGPVAPLIALLTMATLRIADRRRGLLRSLRPMAGVPLLLLIVLPWFVAIHLASQGAFLRQAVGTDLLPKLLGGQESHGAWPGFYALLFTATFWPGSLLAAAALWPAWRSRVEPGVRFLLAWTIPTWVLFELVPTKLPHYILPVYPAIALLTGMFLERLPASADYLRQPPFRWLRWPVVGLWGLVTLLLGLGLAGLPVLADHVLSPPGLLALGGALLLPLLLNRFSLHGSVEGLIAACLVGSLLVLPPALDSVLPGLSPIWLSKRVVAALRRQGAHYPYPLASTDYTEPSLVFLAGTSTLMTDPAGAAAFLKRRPDGWALIGTEQTRAFLAAAKAKGLRPARAATIDGFNYTKGRRMHLVLYRRNAAASPGPPP